MYPYQTFLNFLRFWCPWQLWGVLARYFAESLSTGIYQMFFLGLDYNYMILGKHHRDNMPFSSYHIKGKSYQCDVTMFTFISHLLRWCLSGFSSVRLLFSHSPCCSPCKEVTPLQSVPKDWRAMLHSLTGVDHIHYLEFSCRGDCIYCPQFIYFFNYYGIMGSYFIQWVII